MTELKGLNGDQATMPLHPGYASKLFPVVDNLMQVQL